MNINFKGIFLTIILISLLPQISPQEIPNCTYSDTVDLTDIKPLPNGSYEYAGVLIPVEQTGTYNYKIHFEGTRTVVPEHKRGCVCKFKSCIRYCCHRYRIDPVDDRKCIEEFQDMKVNITLEDESQREAMISHHFVVQMGIAMQCDQAFHVWPHVKHENWKLYENGVLHRAANGKNHTKGDFCLQPQEVASLGHIFMMPINCSEKPNQILINLVSACILLLTCFIYIFVLQLRHVHDKCYFCYLICLLTNLILIIVANRVKHLFGAACFVVAYLGYFSAICIYLWLTVIAYDRWRKIVFHMYEVVHEKKFLFRKYSIFVWGTASGWLLITIVADHVIEGLNVNSTWKVGYAYYECFAKMTDWSIYVYLLGPVGLLVTFNITVIVITTITLYTRNKNNRKQLKEFGQRHNKNSLRFFRFKLYLHYLSLAVMDYTIDLFGAAESVSRKMPPFFFYIVFYVNLVHCLLIFVVTIRRRDVMKALALR